MKQLVIQRKLRRAKLIISSALCFFLLFAITLTDGHGRDCRVANLAQAEDCQDNSLSYRLSSLLVPIGFDAELNGAVTLLNNSPLEHELVSTLAGGTLSQPTPTMPSLNDTPSIETPTAGVVPVFSNLNISAFAIDPVGFTRNTNWVSQLGTVGEIGLQMDLLTSIIDLLLKNATRIDALNINLSVDAQEILPYITFQGKSTVSLDKELRPFLSNLNIRLTADFLKNIGVASDTELDPDKLEVLKENLKITIGLGSSTSFSGETIFERGQGLSSQIFGIESTVGDIRIAGQAIFTPTSQEFRVGASICNLAFTGASLITASGQIQQSFGFELKFGGLTSTSSTTANCQ
jgi:hypothetical protein